MAALATSPLTWAIVGLAVGFVLRSLLWYWYIRCPHRFAFWLSRLIAEWARRAGFTHVHVNAGERPLPFEQLSSMLQDYGQGDAPVRFK